MSKQFWKWSNGVEATDSKLILEGAISSEDWWGDNLDVTPQAFREELASRSGDLVVSINSPGGDVFAGVSIYNTLAAYEKGNITVEVSGIAASIASVIAMAGDKVIMLPGSSLMIHSPWTMGMGNAQDLQKVIDTLNSIESSLVPIYAARTGLSEERIKEMLDDETWMNPQEAVELGFADEYVEAKKKVGFSDSIKNALNNGQFAFSMSATKDATAKLVEKMKAEEVEEAHATDTTPPVDEAAEQAVETETPSEEKAEDEVTRQDDKVTVTESQVETEAPAEVKTAEAPKVEEIEVQEMTEPVTEQTNPVVKETKAMTQIAESQVLEPKAQAAITAPVVNAKEWFKSKEAVEAFTMALANNPGSSFKEAVVQNAYKDAQVKAGIVDPSVFTLPEPVITSIEDAVKSGEIYSRMNHSGLDVYGLTWDSTDSEVDTSRAGGFRPDVDRVKEEQVLDFENRVIRAQYIYKYLVLGKETIRENRSTGALVRFVLNELPVRIIRELERAAIIGDGRAAGNKRKITSFVSVKADAAANAGAGNAFASTYTRAAGVSLAEAVRRAATLIEADGEVVLIAKKGFAVDAQFERNTTGDLLFPIGTSAPAVLGVSTIIEPTWFTDATDPENDAYLVVLSRYMTVGDNSIEAFTNFKLETNENEFLQEIYKGGALAAVNAAVAISATVAA